MPTPVLPRREFDKILEVSLRLNISKDSVRRLVADGVLPAYRIPGLRGVLIRRTDVDALPQLIDPNGFVDDEIEK